MKIFLTRRKLHTVKHALWSVLIMLAASLLFSCGSESPDVTSAVLANLSKSQAVQCSNVATIAAGLYHTVGLNEDGTVVAVGYNAYGQVDVSTWTKIKAIAAGAYHTVGLKEDGTVIAVGYNGQGQLNVAEWKNIKAIAAGAYHTVGLKEDGTVVAVGYGDYDQLKVTEWKNIKAIAAGVYHTVGLNEDGTVVAVGFDGYGQLTVTEWKNIKAIAAGAYHTVGLKEDGTVAAVGNNGNGQLKVAEWTNIQAIAADEYHTVGLREEGTVVAVGSNGYGQLDVSSFVDIMPLCGPASEAGRDAASPITTVVLTGTPGTNGWYVSDVQMTLTATDNDGGSGVKELHYSVDGIETVVQGSSVTLSIAGDGTHAVTWYAIDNEGNGEALQEMSINIDKTSPSILSLATDRPILWPPNHKMIDVFIGGSVADGGSGIASTTITVTDEYGIYNMAVTGFGNAIPLEAWREGTDRDGRVYTITAVTTDQAGNRSTGTTTVVVPHDACPGPLYEDRRHGDHHYRDHHDQDNHHDHSHR